MLDRQRLHQLVDQLPVAEAATAERYLEFLIATSEAPIDADMLTRIDVARAEPGPGIPHADVLREFDA